MSVSDTQYAAFIDRVIACREAEDRAKSDTKALYAEIAEAGEDKTAIGLVVRELRMSNKDRVKADFRDAAVADGRTRYRRGKASHTRAREESPASTTQNASVPEGFDPETGEEVTTPNSALAASNSDADAAVPSGAAKEIATPLVVSAPIHEMGDEGANATDDAQNRAAAADQSTGASQERAQTATGVGTGGDHLGPASRSMATAKTDVPSHQSQASGGGQSQHNSGVRVEPVDPPSLTGSAADPGEGIALSPALSDHIVDTEKIAPTKLKMNAEFFDEPHPLCRDQKFCGGNSNLVLCEKCRAAAGIDGHVHDADERVLN